MACRQLSAPGAPGSRPFFGRESGLLADKENCAHLQLDAKLIAQMFVPGKRKLCLQKSHESIPAGFGGSAEAGEGGFEVFNHRFQTLCFGRRPQQLLFEIEVEGE